MVKIYLQNWFTCPLATLAPLNDILLIEVLIKYRKTNEMIANLALKTFFRHLWYISDIALGFSFFDPRHTEETLIKMTAALKHPGDQKNLFRNVTLDCEQHLVVTKMVSENTMKFFDIIGVGSSFLDIHPSYWPNNENYKRIKEIVQNISVVNDPAERAIGLIKTVNNTLTKDHAQQNELVQVIEQRNKTFKNNTKGLIVSNLK